MSLLFMSLIAIAASPDQPYPYKPVRIVTSSAGGGNDFATRVIAQGISASLGQQVVVDNRSSDIPGEIVKNAAADGYTLLVAGSSHWLLPFLMSKSPLDPVKDYAPITLAVTSPNVIVTHPSVPANSVQELVALAKAKPGVLNYASGSTGSSNHLAAELFKSMASIDIVRITYRGSSPAMTAVMSNEAQIMFANTGAVMPQIRARRLKGLAVTSARPTELAPGLPTVSGAGLAGYEATTAYGVFAPARTPAAVIKRLNMEMVNVLHRPEVKERFFQAGVESLGTAPEELTAAMKAEMAMLGKLIREKGIRNE